LTFSTLTNASLCLPNEVVTVCAITRQVNGLVVLVVGSSGKYCCGPVRSQVDYARRRAGAPTRHREMKALLREGARV
jgi:hypothetical protein